MLRSRISYMKLDKEEGRRERRQSNDSGPLGHVVGFLHDAMSSIETMDCARSMASFASAGGANLLPPPPSMDECALESVARCSDDLYRNG